MNGVPFERVLVANRGEIAVRIIATLRRLGISPVVVHSEADRDELHVALADAAVCVGPAPARDSYLRVDAVVAAALATGAEAVHPGYGFLSEQPALARACADAGLVFVGPPAAAIETMGDKLAAKRTVAAAGVPVVPGRLDAGMDDTVLLAAATEIGFPVLIKPSAGGGGKGMRRVDEPDTLPEALAAARREALAAFGDDTLLVERYLDAPRHIEIQVLADHHGTVVHLGERECSLQRRHQKVIEEAPSPFVTAATRSALGAQAVEAARACGYRGAGTVEFIMAGDRPDEFFFMEMNTRLQVEHPVTEMVTGVDLVEWQLRVAAGEPLPFAQDQLVATGHAVEARIYAEAPGRGFVPTGGTVVEVLEPHGPGIRVDSGVRAGSVVSSHYDPLLAKVIAHAPTRAEAIARLRAALGAHVVVGVETNTTFLRALLAHPDVAAGNLDTTLVERVTPALLGAGPGAPPDDALAAAALAPLVTAGGSPDPWIAAVGWRHGGPAWITTELHGVGPDAGPSTVRLRPRPTVGEWDLAVDDGPVRVAAVDPAATTVTLDGVRRPVRTVAGGGATRWVVIDGTAWGFRRPDPAADRALRSPGAGVHGVIRSPMPGVVVSVAAMGTEVVAGQLVGVVEAMKMEHHLRAPADGRVCTVAVRAGQQVALDEVLLEIEPLERPVDASTPATTATTTEGTGS